MLGMTGRLGSGPSRAAPSRGSPVFPLALRAANDRYRPALARPPGRHAPSEPLSKGDLGHAMSARLRARVPDGMSAHCIVCLVNRAHSIGSTACPVCGDLERDPDCSGVARAYGIHALKRMRSYSRDGFALFVPVAPLVPGYLMIAPQRHSEMAVLTDEASPAIRFITETTDALAARFGSAWYFEHVSRNGDGTSCVPHGHVHILPGSPPVSLFHQAEVVVPPDPRIDIIVGTPSARLAFSLKTRHRQHVRRHIAASLRPQPGWDWRVSRHPDVYSETCEIIRSVAAQVPRVVESNSGSSLLVITGESGSGKSSVASIVARNLNINVSELGHAVRERHQALRSEMSLVDFADRQFSDFGPTTFVADIAPEIPDSVPHIVVGARRPEEVAFLHAQGFNLKIVWIEAATDERVLRRCASLDDVGYFQHRDRVESRWGIQTMRELADLHVRNDAGDLQELAQEISTWWNCR